MPSPTYFGANVTVSVTVATQSTQWRGVGSFIPPVTLSTTVMHVDGSSTTYSGMVSSIQSNVAFNSTLNTVGLPSNLISGARARNLLSTAGSIQWSSCIDPVNRINCTGLCTGSATLGPNVFWTTSIDIAPNGQYMRIFYHYDGGDGTCASNEVQSYIVTVVGYFSNIGQSPVFPCSGNTYRDLPNKVTVTLIKSSFISTFASSCACNGVVWKLYISIDISACMNSIGCPFIFQKHPISVNAGAHGTYFIADTINLYMSQTDSTLQAATTRSNLLLPDLPTATLVNATQAQYPSGPTDGCYQWEPLNTYQVRAYALSAQSGVPITSIPRICLKPVILQISGSNFGTDTLGVPDSLRVFFVPQNSSLASYEASTTTSMGNHNQLCPYPTCVQTDTLIKVWVPNGLGRNLRIFVQVGNQGSFLNLLWSYSPPGITMINPGSVKYGMPFLDAMGGMITILGQNFGGIATNMSVMLSGVPCLNATWNFGGNDGTPYLTCIAQQDVVAPRSIALCLAGQTTFQNMYRSDGTVLTSGNAVGAWSSGSSYAIQYQSLLMSKIHAACFGNQFGGLFQLCQPCPHGARCAEGSMGGAQASPNFYALALQMYQADGSITPQAQQLCDPQTYNSTLYSLYPNLEPQTSCNAFVGCQPVSACTGNNTCAPGYEYAMYRCLSARNYANKTSWSSISRSSVANTTNSCRLITDPYTNKISGVNSDCRGNLSLSTQCTSSDPEHCSICSARVDANGNYFGVCQCIEPPQCSLCTMGSYYRLNNECQACPSSPYLVIFLLIAAAIVVASMGWFLQHYDVNMAFITVGVDYFQILAVLATTNIPWPSSVKALFNLFSIFNFNIDIVAPECITPNFDYSTKWWITMLIPVVVLVILVIAHVAISLHKLRKYGSTEFFVNKLYSTHTSVLISIFIICVYYLYLMLTKRALEIFNCAPLTPDNGYTYTDFTSLSCDGGSLCKCWDPNSLQMQLVNPAIAAIIVYSFGFPAMILFFLWKNADIVLKDQYMRAYDVGNTRESNPECYDIRKKYSKLYYQFKPRFAKFWIIILIARKFWVAFAGLIFTTNPTFQMGFILLILFVALVLQVLWSPFLSTAERVDVTYELKTFASKANEVPELLRYVGIQRYIVESQRADIASYRRNQVFLFSPNQKSTNVRPKLSRQQKATMYFTNLNTLELTLVSCSVFISLSGIMFTASMTDTRDLILQQVNVVGIVTVLLIVSSLIYYVLFFFCEVFPEFMKRMFKNIFRRDYDGHNQNSITDLQVTYSNVTPMQRKVRTPGLQEDIKKSIDEVNNSLKIEMNKNAELRQDIKEARIKAQVDDIEDSTTSGYSNSIDRKDFAQKRLLESLTRRHASSDAK